MKIYNSNENIDSTMHVTDNPVTESPNTPKETLIDLIIKAYCDERTAVHQYTIAWIMARGEGYPDVVSEYLDHIKDEDSHSFGWLQRLNELNVAFDYDLIQIQNSGNKWTPIKTSNIKEQLTILIQAENDAVNFYQKVIEAARVANDEITKSLAKEYQATEQEHATDLQRILESLS